MVLRPRLTTSGRIAVNTLLEVLGVVAAGAWFLFFPT
jgi:hypothetical protein